MLPFRFVFVVSLFAAAGALAQTVKSEQGIDKPPPSSDRNESVGGTVIPSEEAEAAKEHWTPQRMRDAKEKPLLHADPKRNTARSEISERRWLCAGINALGLRSSS